MAPHETAASVNRILIADDSHGGRWDEYASRRGSSGHAFCWAWRSVFKEAFGHTPVYLMALGPSDEVVGVLPLFAVNSRLWGRLLVSVPYLSGGGVSADSSEVADALVLRAAELGADRRARYVELRMRGAHPAPDSIGGREVTLLSHKIAMVLKIGPDVDAVFGAFSSKLRSQVRRPIKAGFVASSIPGGEASERDVDAFYSVFQENMHDLGTPVYPRSLFSSTLRSFGEAATLVLVRKDDVVAAGGIVVTHRGYSEIPWASSLRHLNRDAPNMLLYWECIQWSCRKGCTEFDFGRTTSGSGTHQFKAQWGSEPTNLTWQYVLVAGKGPKPDPHRGGFSPLVGFWRRLPLPLANRLGPWITRSLP